MIKDPTHVEDHFRIVNDLLISAPPMEAYCLGIASARLMAHAEEIQPDRGLFRDAMKSGSPSQADIVVERWLRDKKARSL